MSSSSAFCVDFWFRGQRQKTFPTFVVMANSRGLYLYDFVVVCSRCKFGFLKHSRRTDGDGLPAASLLLSSIGMKDCEESNFEH